MFIGVMKCKKCKCRRRTWLLTTGTPPGAKATLMAGSAGDIRLCMDTSSAWWQSARSWMTWPARVCVGVVVCMILCFCISAALLRTVFSCIVTVCALVLQKIESDSRDSACEPAPSLLLRSSLTHAHRCIGPRNQPGRCLHTGWSGEGRVPMPFSLPVLFSYVSGPQRVSDFVESIWNCL